jgi:hypothetical protein
MYNYLYMKTLIIFFACIILTSCTIYTEKRSEALSQAVFATSDSIDVARIDLAEKYSKEAEKLAYPPKNRIKILPILTKDTVKHEIKNENIVVKNTSNDKISSSVVKTAEKTNGKIEEQTILRLVIPEKLKHSKLLIENSEEWLELIKNKEFSEQLKVDYQNLNKLKNDIEKELQKQQEMNNQIIKDLNKMQKQLVEKDLAILKRNIIIVLLLATIGGATYLRIKGIL